MSQVPSYRACLEIRDARAMAKLTRDQLGAIVFPTSKPMSQYISISQMEVGSRGLTLDLANRIDKACGSQIVDKIKRGEIPLFKRLTASNSKNK